MVLGIILKHIPAKKSQRIIRTLGNNKRKLGSIVAVNTKGDLCRIIPTSKLFSVRNVINLGLNLKAEGTMNIWR